jgi:TrmH family RNA methyltransferase
MISSPQNERVKLVRLLQRQSKTRRQEQRLVLEGARLVGDAIQNGVRPDFVFYTADANAPALLDQMQSAGIACLEVADVLMRDMSDTETPQGILGVFPWPDRPAPDAPSLVVVADGWRDPGNLGTLFRTAAAAGVDLVALMPGTVDPFNPKTIGGEAHGFAESAAQDVPHTLIKIPMEAGAESLNAAIAASILIYEARRHTF